MKWLKSVGSFVSPLFTEKIDGTLKLSLGRVAFWICFGIAIYIWTYGTGDIQASHLQMLYITATYNLMKKATWFGSVQSGESRITITHEAEEDEPAPRI